MGSRYSRALLALVVVFALSAAASAASAALPEFKPVPTKKKFTSTSGTVIFTGDGTVALNCSKSTSTGEITSASTLGNVIITFTGCKVSSGGKNCPIKSVGAKEGEIVTKPMKGELGAVNTKEAASGVGLLLEPEEFIATFPSNGCMGEWRMYGSMAAEVTPIGKKQLTSTLVFGVTSGAQNIKEITVKSGKRKPELEGRGTIWTVQGSDEITFEEALEVT